MTDFDDPRRPDHTAYLKQRIRITKAKLQSLDRRLYQHIGESARFKDSMDDFIQGFIIYGTEEAGETGALLRAFARILKKANSYQKQRTERMVKVGENLRHVKSVYRNARQVLEDYHASAEKLTRARRRLKASNNICTRQKTARKAKETLVRVESELFRRKTALSNELEDFDAALRKALMQFFLQLVKNEMITAARLLETYSETSVKLERWVTGDKPMCDWITSTKMNIDYESS